MFSDNFRRVRRGALVATAAVLAASLAACAGGNGSGDLSDRTIKVGVAEGYLPVVDGEKGVHPEMTKMILQELGVKKVEFVPMSFDALVPSLQSGRVDVAASGLYVTPERCKAVSFADPSVFYYDGMAVEKGNPFSIKTFEDVAKSKAKIGAVAGTAQVAQLEAAGVEKSDIQQLNDLTTALDAVKSGRVDVLPFDNVTLGYFLQKPAYTSLQATAPVAPEVDGQERPYGAAVAFSKKNKDLADKFNAEQQKLLDAGEFESIFAEYGLPPESSQPDPRPTTADYCAG